jgi:hypothetical protein
MSYCNSLIALWHDTALKILSFLADKFIVQPGQGLLDVGLGLALAAPEIAQAVVQAVDRQLSFSSRAKVRDGVAKIQSGWLLLRWPLLAVALIFICGWYGIIVVGVAVGVVVAVKA